MKKQTDFPETLQQLYESCNVDKLKKLCAQLKKMLKAGECPSSKMRNKDIPTRKADIIKYLRGCMDEIAMLKAIYAKLSSLEKAAVQEAIASPRGELDLTRFQAKYGARPALSSSWEYYYFRRKKKPTEFAWLSLWMTTNGCMPRELRDHLKTFVKPPRALSAVYLETLPETQSILKGQDEVEIIVHSTENAALRDVVAMLRLLEIGKIGIGPATGRPTKPGAKMIRKVLSSADFYPDDLVAPSSYDVDIGNAGIRPFAWAMLMQAAGLAQANGNKLGLSQSGNRALKKQPPDLLKQIWNRWLKNRIIHEMNRIEVIKGQKSKGRPLAAAAPDRQNIAQALAELDEGRWIEIDAFFKFLIASGNNITVTRNSWKLYIAEAHYGSLGYDHVAWHQIKGRFTMAFLLEYAATLGIIDVALIPPWHARSDFGDLWGADDLSCLSRYDGLIAIRLNSLGAWILGNRKKYEPVFHDEPCFQVLPNMEISQIASGAAPGDILFLERFCDNVSDQVWQMSSQKILECTEQGIGIDDIRKFLEDRNRNKLPQPVSAFLKDMEQRTGQVKDAGAARLIECASASVARLIANDTQLKKLCMLAGKRHLVVSSENEKQFKKALRGLGFGMALNG